MASPAAEGRTELHPGFPVVSGVYQLTQEWAITLQQPLSRRIEDGTMVLWRPTFTVRLTIWNNPKDQTAAELYSWWRSRISSEATEIAEEKQAVPARFCYRLQEERDSGVVYELDGFVFGPSSHVQVSVYFDNAAQIEEAREAFNSIVLSPNSAFNSTSTPPLRGGAAAS